MRPSYSWPRARAGVARQILPQLKFHYAGDVPVYSTSDSFEPDPTANSDLDGMLFPDMPWMVASDPVTAQIRDGVRAAWPARTARRDRLYAFGFDAYRLVPALRSQVPGRGERNLGGDRQIAPRRSKSDPPRPGLGADQERSAQRLLRQRASVRIILLAHAVPHRDIPGIVNADEHQQHRHGGDAVQARFRPAPDENPQAASTP